MELEATKEQAALEAKLELKRTFLRTALMVAGGMKSSPEATRAAGEEAALLKSEIQSLEQKIAAKAA